LNGAVRNEESLPLPGAVKVGWAIGESAIACHMAIISVYLLFYLTEVHHFPGALAGTLILIPRVWNLVTDPLMGGISDRVKSRWGRRRPFLLAGAVVWALSYVAMFWMPIELTLTQKTVWLPSRSSSRNSPTARPGLHANGSSRCVR
jgi:GPH family glycoside/pentoside/hexuronide:cation symporter